MAEGSGVSRVVFRLSQHEVAGEISLKAQDWRVLTQIDGARTVADVAQASGLAEDMVWGILEMLLKSGFLEIAPGSPPLPRATLDTTVLKAVSKELARAMGPMAEIIMDEEISALAETREQFPRDRLPELVERLSGSIRDETKRLTFQQSMLDIIRRS